MKLKKVIILLIINIGLLSSYVYAKYVYYFDEITIKLSRNTNAPICTVSYSTEEWTNQNVIITIMSNKEIEQVSGFELSEDKKILTKEVTENENSIVKVRDFSGNETQVEYEVNNIDKERPQILGCENGTIYASPLQLDYYDNVEIKEILVDKYDAYLMLSSESMTQETNDENKMLTSIIVKVNTYPKNTKKYRYFLNNEFYTTTDEKEFIFTGLERDNIYQIKVEAIDATGKILDTQTIQCLTNSDNVINSNNDNKVFSAQIDPYYLTDSGNYQIVVKDLAENETIYEIKIK